MTRRELLAFVLVAVFIVPAFWLLGGAAVTAAGQEVARLATPLVTTKNAFEIAGIELRRLPRWSVRIVYVDDLGVEHFDLHQDDEARALVVALNKANLSAKSLERRALEHLIAEGKIPAATIDGVPR